MHTLLRRLLVAGTLCTLIAWSDPVVAQDAGPVTKPLSEPNLSTDRLPAPKPSARQGTDGKITVTWAPVEGAISYRLWRSVPPTPQAVVTLANPQATSYVDADVKAGSTYYYLVAAVNEGGIEGLRGATTPVAATMSADGTTAAPTVKASITQQDPLRVFVSFNMANAASYEIERVVSGSSQSADPSKIDYRFQQHLRWSVSSTSITDPIPSEPYLRSVIYFVRARLSNGVVTGAGRSEELILPAKIGTTSSTTGTSTSYNGSSATGSTTLTVAALATLTTGATTSLGSAGGSSARWLSLNDAIATVDASGTVTARAGGTTQVLAVSTSPDGSVRVVAIPLAVKP